MKLLHIKLDNGEDLLAKGTVNKQQKTVELHHPITVTVDPDFGLFAKSWMLLSESNSISLSTNKIIYVTNANANAVSYYKQFFDSLAEKQAQQHIEQHTDDLEDVFTAILESKSSIKH